MKRIYLDYLEDIEEAMVSACRFVEGMDYASFAADAPTNFAVVRALEIMGEATKSVPVDIQKRFPISPGKIWPGCETRSFTHILTSGSKSFGIPLKSTYRVHCPGSGDALRPS